MKDFYVLLHNVRSLWNVGSVFRTSDGAGIKKVFLCGQTGYPPRPDITKTAIGAEKTVDWEYWIDARECMESLKKQGFQMVALELTAHSIDYRDFKSNKPVCLVLGHEISGVDDDLLSLCDASIQIPMRGKKESLNVATAFGIAAYELTR